jgi:hypothetical protein
LGDDVRDRKAPFEEQSQVDDDAEDDQQQRHRTIFSEFLADLPADEFDAKDRNFNAIFLCSVGTRKQ